MNFLAHLWLAGPAVPMRLGAVAGDFVKGPLPAGLAPDIAAGAELHRAIDAFADRHPAFQASRARVSDARRRFAGVMVDMFYDHFLAAHWDAYHPDEPLPVFAMRQYALLNEHRHRLPEAARPVVARMSAHDWLTAYAEANTIELALDRIAARLRRPGAFVGSGEELHAHYAAFEADSARFLHEAMAFARATRARLEVS
ncbi:DUF479 domain-containing protein [Nitrogeniibacter mangrovi]|uniref:DUF479 domain-containing protein n=1 Tax=Nitrogeniibacter mangrovi TaxID=2016596 RepID=A0A6C1B195_9RHOO|nr:ACP phosphodiesterase [Nitrogeniibacter mangrovi]QID16598.1 DUF479 domain-containing protein [Nitrogeniibacter mangrovi]